MAITEGMSATTGDGAIGADALTPAAPTGSVAIGIVVEAPPPMTAASCSVSTSTVAPHPVEAASASGSVGGVDGVLGTWAGM